MQHSLLHPLALAILVVQGVFGSVSPAAVICISHGHGEPIGREDAAGAGSGHCGESKCCTKHTTEVEQRPTVALAPPCEDGCPTCVDIGLPDHEMLTGSRAERPVAAMTAWMTAPALDEAWRAMVLRRALPCATGPPQLSVCPHALIVRSTRLLL
jgi:hypothetical protein